MASCSPAVFFCTMLTFYLSSLNSALEMSPPPLLFWLLLPLDSLLSLSFVENIESLMNFSNFSLIELTYLFNSSICSLSLSVSYRFLNISLLMLLMASEPNSMPPLLLPLLPSLAPVFFSFPSPSLSSITSLLSRLISLMLSRIFFSLLSVLPSSYLIIFKMFSLSF